jgi:hypothetical protein
MQRCGLAVAAGFAVLLGPALALAGQAVPIGTQGVLEVDYVLEGKHASKNNTDSIEWTVERVLKAVYRMRAGELTMAGMSDAAQRETLSAGSAAVAAQGEKALADNPDFMAQLQKGAEACGEDEACLTALAMKMANQPGAKSMGAAAAGVGQSAKNLVAANPPRFQTWIVGPEDSAKSRAEASDAESLKRVVYDPICVKTKNICTTTRTRQGKQTYPALGEAAPGIPLPTVEIDTVGDRISVLLAPPLVQMAVQESVVETPELQSGEAGTRKTSVAFTSSTSNDVWEKLHLVGLPYPGGSGGAHGEKVITLPGIDDYQAPLKLTVRWRFHQS